MKPPIYEPAGKAKEYGEYTVYMHIFPNGKKYIGISRNVKKRFRNGEGYARSKIVYSAIQKYGWENVSHEILYENLSEQEAKQKEVELIRQHDTTNHENGYNSTLGGEGGNGRKMTEAEKIIVGMRFSAANKGRHLSEEHKKKLSDATSGKPQKFSEKRRESIIRSNSTRGMSEETRKKISENTKKAMKEKNMSEYLSKKWNENKEERKEMLRKTMMDRYGGYGTRKDLIT